MSDLQPLTVAQIDKSILQTIGRLTYGTMIDTGEARVTAPFHRGVPSAFLFIEFWRIAMGFERGGAFAWDPILQSLERRKLFETKTMFLFVQNGIYCSQDGQKWVIERRCERKPIYADGELFTTIPDEKLYCFIQSAGENALKELQNHSMGVVNLYMPGGMRLDIKAHPHHLLTDEGWRLADLAVSDFVDDPPASSSLELLSGPADDSDDSEYEDIIKPPISKRPTEAAFIAWRLRDLKGLKTQKEIAATMSKELKRRVSQGEVSRWLSDVDAYRKAGGVFPDLPTLTAKPQSIDPSIQDMGERRDHKTPRQRPQHD